jgi:hypothetical protein
MKQLTVDSESMRLGSNAFQLWSERYSPQRALGELEAAYEEAIERAR